MSDWEADDFEPVASKPKFDDDDEEEVKDSWDASDDEEKKPEAPAASTGPKAVPPPKKKTPKQIAKEKEEKEAAERAARLKKKEEQRELTPEEQLAEKIRRQQLVEEADLANAKELFGVSKEKEASGDSALLKVPKTLEEFGAFEEELVKVLTECEKSAFFVPLLENLNRRLCANISLDDAKKVERVLTVIVNDKQKALKSNTKKKKGAAAKKTLNRGMDDDDDGSFQHAADDYGADEYDFM
eukprot:Colp12_sorted_trinity150504_noHs@26717